MHSTTMSSLGQTGGFNTTSGYGKKTLGVRRQMMATEHLINFAGVFSGTALDVPRSFAVRLRTEF